MAKTVEQLIAEQRQIDTERAVYVKGLEKIKDINTELKNDRILKCQKKLKTSVLEAMMELNEYEKSLYEGFYNLRKSEIEAIERKEALEKRDEDEK